MKHLTLILFLLLSYSSVAQHYYLDTLPQLQAKNLLSLQGRVGNNSTGIYYSRNLWNGMGYRNYEQVSIGVNYGTQLLRHYQYVNERSPYLDIDLRLQHNIRLSLDRLFYFSIHFGYDPKIGLKEHPSKIYDDYINNGYAAIGLNGYVGPVNLSFHVGALVREAKQDLHYEIHTYAQFLPEAKFSMGFSF